ncbi:MAG: isoprenylcysteine carboxylmethyltransferase family protein [Anaerolineae bacterium]|nr:isoprenylcysteine carboxylmethyltransferase family protein [Anaerolineae bacterium]
MRSGTAFSVTAQPPGKRIALMLAQGALVIGLLGAVLFGAAGTLDWPRAWRLLGVYALGYVVSTSLLFLRVPELIDERRKAHPGVKPWDRPLVLAYQVMYFPTFAVSGLDRRLGWSAVPASVSLVALVAVIGFFVLITWAPLVNRYLETYVRIQTERGHTVIDDGPYRVIRHPTYAGLALFFLAVPLSLGSWWGLVPGGIAAALVVVRTALEDRTLRAELPGYDAYARRVRYRLLPGIW